ncbi:MAG: aspartate kinase [Firmicutes bacterium]|nr:aspartate kinase [Bacillota bacterium]
MLKVLKFGGSSLADSSQFEKVKDIVLRDPARAAVVVSAPGKRFKKDNKITDLLYLCYAHIKYGVDHESILGLIESRYREIASGLGVDLDIEAEFDLIRENIAAGAGEDYLVSRGEYLSAKLMAAYLDYDFVDAFGTVFFGFDREVDRKKTYEALRLAYNSSKGRVVVPGFFGTMPDGKLALMNRGGSDITGALLAAALEADVYENWTDVPGILMADPGIVDDPYPIPQITYDELRELTYMGAKVLHEAAVFPVREAGIPVNIRNTNDPEAAGTFIAESFESEDDEFYITGVTGRRGFTILDVRYENIGQSMGVFRSVLKLFEKYGIRVEHISSGVDAFSVVANGEALKPHIYQLVSEIEEICGRAAVTVSEGISLVACVSRRMVFRPGISGRLFAALGENKINIRMIAQGAEELTILMGVADADFERTIKVLYDSFTRRN